jgi:hypothetical protein
MREMNVTVESEEAVLAMLVERPTVTMVATV